MLITADSYWRFNTSFNEMDTSNPWNQLTAFLYNCLIDELLYVISPPCSPEPERSLVPADVGGWLQRNKKAAVCQKQTFADP